MNPEDYADAFAIIARAGEAKSHCMLALREARGSRFEAARDLLAVADEKLNEAHSTQMTLLSVEARGEVTVINLMMIHAQDHLASALLLRDLAEEFLALYAAVAGSTSAP